MPQFKRRGEPTKPMKLNPGDTLVITGIGHSLLALAIPFFRNSFIDILKDGYVGSLSPNIHNLPRTAARHSAWWFVQFGVLMVLFGTTLSWMIENTHQAIPQEIAWGTIIFSSIGAIGLPISGYWLVLVQGIWMLHYR
ncbi:hypothetical protein BDR26DRAFT_852657 [Obelidium mucronatum]|nr:hypothetical protein BDR26DRAFT_852657 [Obelidium mucronatum]